MTFRFAEETLLGLRCHDTGVMLRKVAVGMEKPQRAIRRLALVPPALLDSLCDTGQPLPCLGLGFPLCTMRGLEDNRKGWCSEQKTMT